MAQRHDDPAIAVKSNLQRISIGSFVFQSAIADDFGLHPRDLQGISYLSLRGALTAGELSRLLGLTTGATTALIDRIVKNGFATRRSDPEDARRVVVQLGGPQLKRLQARYRAIERHVDDALRDLSPAQVRVVAAFLERVTGPVS